MITVHDLRKRFGAVTALDGLSFDVEPGETFAIIGPNGAGKTTTLKILLGLAHADTGVVTIGPRGLAPSDARARSDLGYVPQRVSFTGGRTARQVLRFFADLRDLPADAVDRALERVGLQSIASRRASELSGGYTQRLALAQALLGDPAILVLDEPTASLDPEATWEFRRLIEQLRTERKTIVLCSHLLAEVERVADRVLILVSGRRAALERVSDLRERQVKATRLVVELVAPDLRVTELLAARGFDAQMRDGVALWVDAADGRAHEALDVLRGAGVGLRGFELQRPTLEDVFLDVVRGDSGRA